MVASKIICATPTLAAGLSLPVFRVIIKSLKRFAGGWGMKWIPVQYLQMAGRAGRPEYEDYGEAIIIAKNESERDEVYERYICGQPEDIYSKLAAQPILRNHVLSLVSSGIIRSDKDAETSFQTRSGRNSTMTCTNCTVWCLALYTNYVNGGSLNLFRTLRSVEHNLLNLPSSGHV